MERKIKCHHWVNSVWNSAPVFSIYTEFTFTLCFSLRCLRYSETAVRFLSLSDLVWFQLKILQYLSLGGLVWKEQRSAKEIKTSLLTSMLFLIWFPKEMRLRQWQCLWVCVCVYIGVRGCVLHPRKFFICWLIITKPDRWLSLQDNKFLHAS